MRVVWTGLSLTGFVAIWAIIAFIAQSRVLPGPIDVWNAYLDEQANGYWYHMGATLLRVMAAFTLSMVIGSAIGLALGRSEAANRAFGGWLTLFLNLPALVTIVLCYVWFSLTEVAAIAAVAINKIPNVAATMREGARALSKDLNEMAQVYRLSPTQKLTQVVLPQLAPFFAVAARNGLALVWKIVLVVELLGRGSGVGFQINTYFQLFDVAAILAYAVGFIVIVQAIELGILEPWERHVTRWRR